MEKVPQKKRAGILVLLALLLVVFSFGYFKLFSVSVRGLISEYSSFVSDSEENSQPEKPKSVAFGNPEARRDSLGAVKGVTSQSSGQVKAVEDNITENSLVFRLRVFFLDAIEAASARFDTDVEVGNDLSVENDVQITNDLDVGGGITVAGEFVSTGDLTAPNVLYSLLAGDGITLTGDQDITIANADTGSAQEIFKNIKVGSVTISADDNDDTFTLEGGSGVSLLNSGKTITIAASGSDLNVSGWFDDGASVRLVSSTDNVGIGTDTPGYKLHVVGDSYFSGVATFASGTIVSSGINNSSGGITNAGSITGATGFTSSGTITFSNFSTGVLQTNVNGVVSSAPVFLGPGSTVISGVLPVTSGGTGISSLNTGDILYASASSTLAALGAGSDGEVLTISGGIPAWGTAGGSGPCATCLVNNPNSTQTITPQNSTATGLVVKQASGGSVDVFRAESFDGSSTFFRVDSSGNVILGDNTTSGTFTVSPGGTDPITIDPVAQGAGSFEGTITSLDLTAPRTWQFPDLAGVVCLSTGNCSGTSASIGGSGSTNYLTKWSDTYDVTASIVFDDGNNVGIGTTTMNSLLDIAGTLNVDALASFGGDVSVAEHATISGSLRVDQMVDLNSTLGVTGATNLSSTLDVTGLATFGGNVGIGSATPGYKLDIDNTSNNLFRIKRSGNTIATFGSNPGGPDNAQFGLYSGGSANIYFASRGNETSYFLPKLAFGQSSGAPAQLSVGGNSNSLISDGANLVSTGGINLFLSSDQGLNKYALAVENADAGGSTAPHHGVFIRAGRGTSPSYALRIQDYLNNDLFTIRADGNNNVGIATTSPSQKLDVNGAIRLGAASANNVLNTSAAGASPTGLLYWGDRSICDSSGNCSGTAAGVGGSGTTNYVTKWSDTYSMTDSIIYDDGARIGIGTGSPASRFEVQGAITGKALTILNETGDQAILVASASGTNRFIIQNDGNVGIGTTVPGEQLELTGNLKMANTTYIGQSSSDSRLQFNYNNLRYYGNGHEFYSESGSTILKIYQYGSNADMSQNPILGIHSISIADTGYSSALGISTELRASADNDILYGMYVDPTYNHQSWTGVTDYGLYVAGSASNYFGGNVGINSTSPGYLLDVSGTAAAALFKSNNDGFELSSGAGGTARLGVGSGSNYVGSISDNDFSFRTNDIDRMYITNAGRVGIGTSAPVAQLQVEGAPTGKALLILNQQGDQDIISASASGSTKFRVMNNGNVGIGITSVQPTHTLDVFGTMSVLNLAEFTAITNPGIGTNSEKFGLNAVANGDSTVAIGNGATANAFASIAIGAGSSADGIRSIAIGNNTTNDYNDTLAIGHSIGGTHNALIIGNSATTGWYSTLIGHQSDSAGGWNAVGVGYNVSTYDSSIAFGRDTNATASNQLVAGSNDYPINDLYFGKGVVNATPSTYTINGTGGSGTDIGGGGVVIQGGRATGDATGGSIYFSTSDAGTSGTALQGISYKMEIAASGNVGIGLGSTTPAQKLHVNGNNWVEGKIRTIFSGTENPGNGGLELQRGTNEIVSMRMDSGGDLNYDFYDGVSSWNNRFTFTREGNLGIGTTGPAESLHTTGNILLENDQYLKAKVAGGTAYNLLGVTTGDNIFVGDPNFNRIVFDANGRHVFNINGSEVIRIDGSGNLGIGTTTPVGKLNVHGALTGKALTILNETGDQDIFVASASGVTRTILSRSGQLVSGNNIGSISYTSSRGFVSSLTGDNYISVRSGDSSIAGLLLGDTTADYLGRISYDNSTNNLGIWTNNAERLTVQNDGNVGIGSTSPGYLLDVADGARITGATATGGNGLLVESNGQVAIGGSAASLHTLTVDTSVASWPILFTNSTSNISNTLKIQNSGGLGADRGSSVQFLGTSGAETGSLAFAWEAASYDDSYFALSTRSGGSVGERLRINNAGNVGIGTTNPTELLHLNSTAGLNVRLKTANNNTSALNFIEDDASGDYGAFVRYQGANNSFRIGTVAGGTETLAISIPRGSSNVGIGTDVPAELLHIENTTGDADIRVRTANDADSEIRFIENNASGGYGGFLSYTGASNLLRLGTVDAGTRTYGINIVRGSANVGIGTTAPAAALDLEGDLRIFGAATASASYAGGKALVVRGAASQTGNLMEWQDSTGGLMTAITANGYLDFSSSPTPDTYNTILKFNNWQSEGFDNGVISISGGNRTFLNLVTDNGVNSLLSGGINGEGSRRFAMTGTGKWQVGGGSSTYDTFLERNSGGPGWLMTGAYNGATNLTLQNTTADITSTSSLLDLQLTDDNDTDANFFRFLDSGGSPMVSWQAHGSGFPRLGINTSNPSDTIHLKISGSVTTSMTITNEGNTSSARSEYKLDNDVGGNSYAAFGLGSSAGTSGVFDSRTYLRTDAVLNGISLITEGAGDDIRFFTAGNSLSELRAIIDGDGKFGLGNASPVGLFDVDGAVTGKALAILNETGDQNIFTASASGTTRFVIQNDGNVGIGTDAPVATLDVGGRLKLDNGSTSAPAITFDANDGTGFYGTTVTGGAVIFASGNQDRYWFTSNYLQSGQTSAFALQRATGSATDPIYTFYLDEDTGLARAAADELTLVTGGAERLRIDANGNVGIGSTSPNYLLDVGGTTASTLFVSNNDGFQMSSGVGGQARLGVGSSSNFVGSISDNDFSIRTNNLDRIYISNTGHVGIGTTTTTGLLNVDGAVTGKALTILNETGDQDIFVASASGAQRFSIGNTGVVSVTNDYDQTATIETIGYGTGSGWIQFQAGGTNNQIAVFRDCCNGVFTVSNTNGTSNFNYNLSVDDDFTVDAGTLFVDSSENSVGIGTTSPVGKLNVQGAVTGKALTILNETGDQDIFTASASGTTIFTIERGGDVIVDNNIEGRRTLMGNGNASGPTYSFINDGNSGIFSPTGDQLGFSVGASEVVRIDSAGNVGIGSSSPGLALDVVGSGRFSAVGSGTYSNDLNLTSDGTLTTSSSDIRLKDNLISMDDAEVLSKVLQLQTYSFRWKQDGSTDIGMVAQEVEGIFPELTFTNQTDGYKGINYSRLPTLLVSALQEQQKQLLAMQLALNEVGQVESTQEAEVLGATVETPPSAQEQLAQYLKFSDLLEVLESVVFKARAQFLASVEFMQEVRFRGNVRFNADTVGRFTLPADATRIKIIFDSAFSQVPTVFLSSQQNVVGGYQVESVSTTEFIVTVSQPQLKDISFDWFAVLSDSDGSSRVEVLDSTVPEAQDPGGETTGEVSGAVTENQTVTENSEETSTTTDNTTETASDSTATESAQAEETTSLNTQTQIDTATQSGVLE